MSEFYVATITIEEAEEGMRLDRVLAGRFKDRYSRSYFQSLIQDDLVLLNGFPAKKRIKLRKGDEVEICFFLSEEIDIEPEDIPLNIIYEDEDIIVANKPWGQVVHPAPGNWKNTFVNALLFHCRDMEKSDGLRPGIVHRLDKDTSGVLVAAKRRVAQARLVEMFAERRVKKEYFAICSGNPGKGLIDKSIARHPKLRQKMRVSPEGAEAVTVYRTLSLGDNLSLVHLFPKTGRTHQLRVHMRFLNTPILGDPLYGNLALNRRYGVGRQLLHAWKIAFLHPVTRKEVAFKAAIPDDFLRFVNRIGYEGFDSES